MSPPDKRIRATFGDEAVVDSTRAMLVWEPRRIVPTYAVPVDDVAGELRPSEVAPESADGHPVLHPGIPFAAHTADGEAVDLTVSEETREGVGLRLADSDLDGYVILDFKASTSGTRRTSRTSATPATPSTASTSCTARAM